MSYVTLSEMRKQFGPRFLPLGFAWRLFICIHLKGECRNKSLGIGWHTPRAQQAGAAIRIRAEHRAVHRRESTVNHRATFCLSGAQTIIVEITWVFSAIETSL